MADLHKTNEQHFNFPCRTPRVLNISLVLDELQTKPPEKSAPYPFMDGQHVFADFELRERLRCNDTAMQ